MENGGFTGELSPPPPYYVESKLDAEAGPLPFKVSLADDVIIASAESLPKKADFVNPWNAVSADLKSDSDAKPWKELSVFGKIWRVTWVLIRVVLVFTFLYLFIIALDIMGSAFQLIGGRTAGAVIGSSTVFNNKVSAMIVGVLVTVLLQSSSTTTSIVVTMVGANILTVQQAIPMIMGANIGTSVTSTLVALTQSSDRDTFRRSFAGATVHDMFNWLTVMILLPIEAATNMLYHITKEMVHNLTPKETDNPQFLNAITDPLVDKIIVIDKSVIAAIAQDTDRQTFPLPEFYCKEVDTSSSGYFPDESTEIREIQNQQFTYDFNETKIGDGVSFWTWKEVNHTQSTICTHLYAGCGTGYGILSEPAGGTLLLVFSLVMMIICLLLMVKLLNSLISGPAAKVTKNLINANFPGKLSWLTGYVSIVVGAILTFLVQSSSVFTSTMTPLVGMGIVTVERVYPLTLGANIGTTFTSLLAAFTADTSTIQNAVQVSLCHLFFNIIGIMMFYPIPVLRRLPIRAAKFLGNTTAKYRWFAIAYLLVVFLLIPFSIFGLSLAGIGALLGVLVPAALLVIAVIVINVMQGRCPNALPKFMRSWDFLPKPLRSLEQYDSCVTFCCKQKCCQKCCTSCNEAIQGTGMENDMVYIVSDEILDPKNVDQVTPQQFVSFIMAEQNTQKDEIETVVNNLSEPTSTSEHDIPCQTTF